MGELGATKPAKGVDGKIRKGSGGNGLELIQCLHPTLLGFIQPFWVSSTQAPVSYGANLGGDACLDA